jgi:hypothetical protein
LQNFFSAFIRDLAEPQEVVEMELKERKKKNLRRIRRLGPKSSYRKGKKVMKEKPALAHDDISEVVPELIATFVTDSYRNTSLKDTGSSPVTKSTADKNEDITSNHASIDEEASDPQVCLPAPLSFQCSQQASSEAVKENTRDVRSKTRKKKLLQASGSVANTTKKGGSSDSLNSGIKQGNVRFQTACKNNQANGFDREKETREMLYDAATLGLGNIPGVLMQASSLF